MNKEKDKPEKGIKKEEVEKGKSKKKYPESRRGNIWRLAGTVEDFGDISL